MKNLILYLLLIGVVSCAPDETDLQKAIPSFIIDNSAASNIEDASDYLTVKTIVLSKENSIKVGGAVRDFIPLDTGTVLIDYETGRLTNVDKEGEILWQLESSFTDPFVFSSVWTAKLNHFSNLIEVADDSSYEVFRFTLDGEFVDRRAEPAAFIDRIAISEDEVLYDLAMYLKWSKDEQGVVNEFATTRDGVKLDLLGPNPIAQVDVTQFVYNRNFLRLGTNIYHQKSFSDTISLFKDGLIEPSFVVKYLHNGRGQEVLDNKRIKNKFAKVLEEQIPYTNQAFVINDTIFSLYKNGKRDCFYAGSTKGDQLINAFYLKVDNQLMKAPYVFRNGTFMSVMFDRQVKELNQVTSGGTQLDEFDPEDITYLTPADDITKTHYFFLTRR